MNSALKLPTVEKSWTLQGVIVPVVLLILTVKFCVKGVFVRVDVLPNSSGYVDCKEKLGGTRMSPGEDRLVV